MIFDFTAAAPDRAADFLKKKVKMLDYPEIDLQKKTRNKQHTISNIQRFGRKVSALRLKNPRTAAGPARTGLATSGGRRCELRGT
jgi:hypothetical protein